MEVSGLSVAEAAGVRADASGRVREYFNRLSSSWERGMAPGARERGRELALSLGIEPGSRVLDVGCGTGVLIPWLAEAVGRSGRLVALDIAEKMLEEARSLHRLLELEFVWADVARMPFPGGAFDDVICHNCFHLFSDGEAALSEMGRILGPGGCAAVSYAWDIREATRRGGDPGAPRSGAEALVGGAVARALSAAGFELLRLEEGSDRFLARARKVSRFTASSGRC
jgi:SAM-dependent methyltransferase